MVMEDLNARIPTGIEELAGKEVFYINNTLVPEQDGSRIIGPLTREQLEFKRERYEQIVFKFDKEQRQKYPFIVYRLEKIE